MARTPTVRLGLHSRPHQLARVDKRTAEGRFVSTVRAELVRHVGGSPTVPQRLLIDAITYKALRLAMITEAARSGTSASPDKLDELFLKYSGSLREDLRLLGLQAPAAEAPTLAAYLEGKAA